jgi:ferredoxin-NADP reductase
MIVNKPYILSGAEKTTPEVTTFTFKAQDSTTVDFMPGMFAMLAYHEDGTGQKISRAYSIANTPNSDCLKFFISMIGGQLTSKLAGAKVGDLYYISAPYGQFKFDINSGNRLLFLAGGTGLAPFYSMLEFIISKGAKPDIVLIYSVKYSDEIIEKEKLEGMIAQLGGKLTVTVTRPKPDDVWKGDTGHVNAQMISKYAPDVKERISYICGPPEFVKALKQALAGLGVPEREIRAEMWG